jgi:protein required for attachment to host cells
VAKTNVKPVADAELLSLTDASVEDEAAAEEAETITDVGVADADEDADPEDTRAEDDAADEAEASILAEVAEELTTSVSGKPVVFGRTMDTELDAAPESEAEAELD